MLDKQECSSCVLNRTLKCLDIYEDSVVMSKKNNTSFTPFCLPHKEVYLDGQKELLGSVDAID